MVHVYRLNYLPQDLTEHHPSSTLTSYITHHQTILTTFTGDLLLNADDQANIIGQKGRGQSSARDPGNNLNTFIQLGDVIEYRNNDQSAADSFSRKGKIISIGSLSSDRRIIGLDDGNWLDRGVHSVKRLQVKRDTGEYIANPNPIWKCLTKFVIIPCYEDVYSDDEDDGPDTGHVHMDVDCHITNDRPHNTQPDHDTNSSQTVAPDPDRKKGKKKRYIQQRRIARDDAQLDRHRSTENYLCWAVTEEEYNCAKDTINRPYHKSLCLGALDEFYDKRIFLLRTKREFSAAAKVMNRFLTRREESGAVWLDVAICPEKNFLNNKRHGVRCTSGETYRMRQTLEETLKFEYKMKTLQTTVCCVCRETRLEFPKGIAKEQPVTGGGVGYAACDNCKSNGYHKNDRFVKDHLHPIWYERKQDGEYKIVNGSKVVRYDVPKELSCLTMAEKLLIRRCSPLIPSHHIKNGVYGIRGHCVCFPQHIENMCDELPHTETNMVIFVRNLSNRHTREIHTKHFKVDKRKVLAALRWLKIHHIGYKHIVIKPSNLDWIKNGSVYAKNQQHNLPTKRSRRDRVTEASETVSGNQCNNLEQEKELSCTTVHPNYRPSLPNKEQGDLIKSLHTTARESNQKYDTLAFPPVDQSEPLE